MVCNDIKIGFQTYIYILLISVSLKFEAILGSVCLNSDLNVTRKSAEAVIPALRAQQTPAS